MHMRISPTAAMARKNFSISGPFVDESFVHVNCWLTTMENTGIEYSAPNLVFAVNCLYMGRFFQSVFIMVSVTGVFENAAATSSIDLAFCFYVPGCKWQLSELGAPCVS